MKKLLPLLFFVTSCLPLFSQVVSNHVIRFDEQRKPAKRQIISIPDVNGYKVLKCDFHMHTVFSDGQVWPSVRLQEAVAEGLDAMALTEHVESHRFKDDVKTDNNRSYHIIEKDAQRDNMILIKGTEISRLTPPGHFNAIFVGDTKDYVLKREANNLELDKSAIMKAAEQDAFIFWNHPGWKPNIDGSYEWSSFLDDLHKNNAIHGIEVFNGFGFHMKALDWCVDKGLTVMGTSDTHNLVNLTYDTDHEYIHRTMTLVMAKDKSAASIREALKAGRTVAWASKYLAGKEENVRNLFNACVKVLPSHYTQEDKNGKNTNFYEIQNNSDLYFELELAEGKGTQKIVLYPKSAQLISAENGQRTISYNVTNTFIRSDKHLNVDFPLM